MRRPYESFPVPRDHRLHRLHHVVRVVHGHLGEERQRQDPVGGVIGVGEGALRDRQVLAVPGVLVNRLVVEAGTDVELLQLRHETVAVDGELFHPDERGVEVPGVPLRVGGEDGGKELRHIGESLIVKCGDLRPFGYEPVQLAELVEADGSLNVHHVVLEAGEHDVVARVPLGGEAPPRLAIHAMELEERNLFGNSLVRGADHSPFAGGDVLVGVEGEDGDRVEGADLVPLVFGADRVGRVLDDRQVEFFCQGADRVHVARLAGEVDRNDGLCFYGDLLPYFACVDVQGTGLDVDQNRLCAAQDNHADRRGEGHGGSDDLVSRLDLQRQERQVLTGGGGAQGDREGCPHVRLEILLEALHLGPGGDPSGTERIDYFVDLVILDGGGGKGEKLCAHACLRPVWNKPVLLHKTRPAANTFSAGGWKRGRLEGESKTLTSALPAFRASALSVGDQHFSPVLPQHRDRRLDGPREVGKFCFFQEGEDGGRAVPELTESWQIDEPGGLVPLVAAEVEFVSVVDHHDPPFRIEREPLLVAEGGDHRIPAGCPGNLKRQLFG